MGELSYTVGGDSNLVSFKSAARMPITSLKAHFKPKQDLHGYSKPWPAGGGKNLLKNTRTIGTTEILGLTITVYSNGSILINGTASGESGLTVCNSITLSAGSYILSGCPAGGSINSYSLDTYSGILVYDYGDGISFSLEQETTFKVRISFVEGAVFNNLIFYPMIRSASETDDTWEPYENICPIEGWNAIETQHSKKNLLDTTKNNRITHPTFSTENGIVNCSSVTAWNSTHIWFTQVFSAGTYTISCDYSGTGSNGPRLICSTSIDGGTWNNSYQGYWKNFTGRSCTFTTNEIFSVALVFISRTDHNGESCTFYNIQLEQGSVATEYEPYQGKQILITFPVLGKNKLPLNVATFIRYKQINLNTPLPIGTYTVSALITSNDTDKTTSAIMFENGKTGNKNLYVQLDRDIRNSKTFTLQQPVSTVYVYAAAEYDSSANDEATWTDIQVELGDTATEYEPYDSSNTVYGGYIDVITGDVVAEQMCFTFKCSDSNQLTELTNTKRLRFATEVPLKGEGMTKAGITYCDKLPYAYTNDDFPHYYSTINNPHGYLYTNVPIDAADNDEYTFVVSLYAPQVIAKISTTQFSTLLNHNNIWSNTNDITEVSYAIHDTAPIRAAKHRMAANEPHIETIENKLVHFNTDMQAPLKSCKVNFEPKQDLHGYDSVWIGGNGKNLFNINAEFANPSDTTLANTTARIFTPGTYCLGISHTNYFIPGNVTTCTVVDNALTVNTKQGYGVGFPLKLTAGSTYYMSATIGDGEVGRIGAAFYDTSGNYLSGISIVSGNYGIRNSSFTIPADVDTTVIIFASENADTTFTNIQLELGSTATSYTPYENICPIEGWNSIETTKCGKNIFGGSALANKFAAKGIQPDTVTKTLTYTGSNANTVGVLFDNFDAGQYTIILHYTSTSSSPNANIYMYYTDGSYVILSDASNIHIDASNDFHRFLSNSSKQIDRIEAKWVSGTTTLYYEDCGIFKGDVSEFESYHDETIPITIPLVNNLLNTTAITTGKTINSTDGTLFNETGMATTDFIRVKEGETYTLSFVSTEGPRTRRIFGYDSNKDPIESLAHTTWATVDASSSITATIPSGVSYIRVCYLNNDTNKILEGPQSYTAYGGYVDLKEGKLIQTHKCITLNGSENWDSYKENQQIHFYLTIPDKKIGLGKSICSHFPNVKNEYFWDYLTYAQYGDHGNLDRIYVNAPYKMPGLVTEWKAYLAEHPMQLCYELATPIEYTLTSTQLKSLKGINNIWSDANGNVEVSYWTH